MSFPELPSERDFYKADFNRKIRFCKRFKDGFSTAISWTALGVIAVLAVPTLGLILMIYAVKKCADRLICLLKK